MKTGRDVIIAALLGAEEFGFATAPLVVSGCIMMRVCHLDTCPVGVATQNPELRKKFSGKPEFVETFFEYIAEEVRQILAELGFKKLEDAIGQVELLDTKDAVEHWKASGLDLKPLLKSVEINSPRKNTTTQDHGLVSALDNKLIELSKDALTNKTPIRLDIPVRNVNRTVGTMLGSQITRNFGGAGLADDTIDITFHGSAGQSFGAFIPSGLTLRLYGDSNDYVGKGLSGGRIIIRPDEKATFESAKNVIAGNVIGYGATSGEIMISGVVGERFCVRNSGAIAIVEGVGDHGCEYMTGGTVIILGKTGRNFAAGMSGGRAFVLDLNPQLVNTEMVDVLSLPLDQEDLVKKYISKFYAETGSKIAGEISKDWPTFKDRISLVMPRDYARVLEVMAKAERSGLSVESEVMAVLNG
jgi:glutamate synthase (NADPH/NADH) large chain